MRSLAAPVCALLAAVLAACASSEPARSPALGDAPRTAWIVGADGRSIGQAQFLEAPTGVLIRLEFSAGALPPGWHGLHLHDVGDCSDFAAGFQASGGHAGMGEAAHGLRHAQGPEAGDLPNIYAAPGGPFGAELFSPRITLAGNAVAGRAPLLDADGSALVIHAGPDDHQSQPIGGAGPRLACAALTRLP